MKEFIIGKEGEQKFKISEKRNKVSRKHCKITIDDNGQWDVDDLDSTNGTYIINEEGEIVQVRHYPITEFTRIILADQTPFGFSFIAHHVLEEDPFNYRKEFIHLLKLHAKALNMKEELDAETIRKGNILKYVPTVISAIISITLTILAPPDWRIVILTASGAITGMIAKFMADRSKNTTKTKAFAKYCNQMLRCPCCGKVMTEAEFTNQMCGACHAHI